MHYPCYAIHSKTVSMFGDAMEYIQLYGWYSCVSVVAFWSENHSRANRCEWKYALASQLIHVQVCMCIRSHTRAWLTGLKTLVHHRHINPIQNPLEWERKRNKQKAHNNIIFLMIYVMPLERQAKTIVSSHSAKLRFGWLCVVFGFSLWSFFFWSFSFFLVCSGLGQCSHTCKIIRICNSTRILDNWVLDIAYSPQTFDNGNSSSSSSSQASCMCAMKRL